MTDLSAPHTEDEGVGGQSPLSALLDLQDSDVGLDQLRHRRAHLPEAQRIDDLQRQRDTIVAESQSAEAARAELLSRQQKLEEEIAEVTTRIHAIESQLTSGTVASFRDQAAMGTEIESLSNRRRQLEDSELEIMEELEPLGDDHDRRERTFGEIAESIEAATAELVVSQASIDDLITTQQAAREEMAAKVEPPLLAEYEKLRAHLGGIGAARLVHGTCSGCNLALSATEIDAIKKAPAGTVAHCEQCGRILVLP